MYRILNQLLITLHAFVAVTATVGSVNLIISNGSGMLQYFLSYSPFNSFFIPGIILIGIVGGTQLLAFITILKRNFFRHEASAVAAFGLLIWIYTEMYLIRETSWLQTIYFSIGIVQLVIVLLLQKYSGQAALTNTK